MSIDVIVILAAIAAVAWAAHWRRCAFAVLLLDVALFAVEGCGPLPSALLGGLQGPYAQRASIAWQARNVVVLLGAGTVHVPRGGIDPALFANGRILEAVSLYHACSTTGHACAIEVSGGDALHTGESEADVYRTTMERVGVPAADILIEPRSMNTWENAEFSAPLLQHYAAQRIVLVSSAMHLRRASLYFSHFGIRSVPERGDWLAAHVGWWPRWWNFVMTDMALHEYAGIIRYHVYNRLGWNITARAPGAP